MLLLLGGRWLRWLLVGRWLGLVGELLGGCGGNGRCWRLGGQEGGQVGGLWCVGAVDGHIGGKREEREAEGKKKGRGGWQAGAIESAWQQIGRLHARVQAS